MPSNETQLQQMIVTLRTRLLVMSAMVGLALDDACKSFKEKDIGRASAVIDGDAAINDLENEIDAKALSILARTQPVAGDLRFVVAALRIVLDLERIADEAARLAEFTVNMDNFSDVEEEIKEDLDELMQLARTIFSQATEAFREGDHQKALKVRQHEDSAALLDMRIMHKLSNAKDVDVQASISFMLITRALSRVWGRAMNLAEQTYFIYTGENLKHRRV